MLTFVFLGSLAATTLLLLSVAAEEVLRVTRSLLTRFGAGATLRPVEYQGARNGEQFIRSSHAVAGLRQLPQRTRAARDARRTASDHIPDQAA